MTFGANPNILPSQRAGLVGVIPPISQGVGSVSTIWFPMKDFESVLAFISAGVLGAAATLDAKFEQATDAAGTGAKDFSPAKAISQLVKASNDDDQAEINLRADEFDVNNDFDHARLTLTVAAAASLVSASVWGHDPHYGPASDKDLASVQEIVT